VFWRKLYGGPPKRVQHVAKREMIFMSPTCGFERQGSADETNSALAPNQRLVVVVNRWDLEWADGVRAHHFVVLVLDDVAVPDELARQIEARFHASDFTRI
jgi:hypothetical protein